MPEHELHPSFRQILEPGEELRATTRARDTLVALTNRRLIVGDEYRVALRVGIDNIRRIQFDIERKRPATLVVVPDDPTDHPQVLVIEPAEYERTAQTLAIIGLHLAESDAPPRS